MALLHSEISGQLRGTSNGIVKVSGICKYLGDGRSCAGVDCPGQISNLIVLLGFYYCTVS